MILASKLPLEHDRHHLAKSRMERIVDPYLERRTPGIVTLFRPARARATSRWRWVLPPVSAASQSALRQPPASFISLWKPVTRSGCCGCRANLPYKLLIIDELGYVPLSPTGAELLFEVFSQRYERGSIIVTSNLPFEDWTSVFGSERLTGALLDRLTHHVHILELNGDSYRLKQSKDRRRKGRDPAGDGPPPAEAVDPDTGEVPS